VMHLGDASPALVTGDNARLWTVEPGRSLMEGWRRAAGRDNGPPNREGPLSSIFSKFGEAV
jgi:hypothetical protein